MTLKCDNTLSQLHTVGGYMGWYKKHKTRTWHKHRQRTGQGMDKTTTENMPRWNVEVLAKLLAKTWAEVKDMSGALSFKPSMWTKIQCEKSCLSCCWHICLKAYRSILPFALLKSPTIGLTCHSNLEAPQVWKTFWFCCFCSIGWNMFRRDRALVGPHCQCTMSKSLHNSVTTQIEHWMF